jgi:ABC-type polysaccharide/polyol phosphate export permease
MPPDMTERDPVLPFRAMSSGDAAATIRQSPRGPSSLALLRRGVTDVLSRRRLIRYLVQADMKKRGSDTVLGNLWWILDPLLQLVVYVVLVAVLSRGRGNPDYPLFIFVAIIPWKWFNAVITDATTSVLGAERLIRQIAFPKLVLPVATTVAGVVGFLWGLVPLALLLLLPLLFGEPSRISLMLVWVPVIAGVQFVFTLAVAILVSAGNVFFRDLGNALGHVLRLWWFLSPGLYSIETLESTKTVQNNPLLADLYGLNPFSVLFEAYRAVIYGTADGGLPVPPNVLALAGLLVASILLLGLCLIFFKRVEPDFAKLL